MPTVATDLPAPLNHIFVDFENVHEINLAVIASKAVGGFKIAMERGVYAAPTWKNERLRISHASMNFDREAA